MRRYFGWAALVGCQVVACGNDAGEPSSGTGGTGTTVPIGGSSSGSSGSESSGNGGSPSSGGGGGTIIVGGIGGGAGSAGTAGDPNVCATETATAELEPVHLAFAFDVSGSMGKGDFPWHDASLKWDPVVAATRAFFEDPASAGLTASLTAFPIDADEDERCDADSYTEPDVPMTALPSSDFGEALDEIREGEWRGGTPTLAAVDGVLSSIEEYSEDHPGRYVLVLVTDGYPASCDEDQDRIEAVEEAVAAVAETIPTYVIGVANPPLEDEDGEVAPDTVSDLIRIAVAGRTDTAFLIDTGDPQRTSSAFLEAMAEIRGVTLSCNLAIPEPPNGRTFEKDKVSVQYRSGSETRELPYDAECKNSRGWHYDDVSAPSEVVLCETACGEVQASASASLSVSFTCQTVIDVPR
jgi:hypothetical protein